MTYLKTPLASLLALIFLAPASLAEPMEFSCIPDAAAGGPTAPCATEFYAMLPVVEDYSTQDVLVTSAAEQCHAVTLTFLLPGKAVHTIEGLPPGGSQRFSFAMLQPLGGEWDETIPETEFQSSPFYPEIMVKATSDGTACAADNAAGWTVTLDLVPVTP